MYVCMYIFNCVLVHKVIPKNINLKIHLSIITKSNIIFYTMLIIFII